MRKDLICEICEEVLPNNNSFGMHLRTEHDGAKQYYENYEPKFCEVCGDQLEYQRHYHVVDHCSERCAYKNRPSGKDHPSWKGGRTRSGGGYIQINRKKLSEEEQEKFLPMFADNGTRETILEHRLVMARHLNRPLDSEEQVHHKDGNKKNNDIDNLELWIRGHPNGTRAKDLECPHCGETYV